MLNKILFAKRIKVNGTDNVYLAPFVYDDKGRDNLHEPHYNLSTSDIVFKGDIIQNMKKALSGRNIEYISADFTSNIVKFKFL
jgi:hypothetical protein